MGIVDVGSDEAGVRAMGVRTNIPFNQLTDAERDIVFNGPAVKKHILYKPKKGNDFAELDFTYFTPCIPWRTRSPKPRMRRVSKRVSRFLSEHHVRIVPVRGFHSRLVNRRFSVLIWHKPRR